MMICKSSFGALPSNMFYANSTRYPAGYLAEYFRLADPDQISGKAKIQLRISGKSVIQHSPYLILCRLNLLPEAVVDYRPASYTNLWTHHNWMSGMTNNDQKCSPQLTEPASFQLSIIKGRKVNVWKISTHKQKLNKFSIKSIVYRKTEIKS